MSEEIGKIIVKCKTMVLHCKKSKNSRWGVKNNFFKGDEKRKITTKNLIFLLKALKFLKLCNGVIFENADFITEQIKNTNNGIVDIETAIELLSSEDLDEKM